MMSLAPEHAAWAAFAAELVNTRPRETDPDEKLRTYSDVRPPSSPPSTPDLGALRSVRSLLLRAFTAGGEEEFAAAVNPLLGTPWALGRAADGWQLAPAPADGAAWLGARSAQGLVELVLAYGLDRLHVCSADDCLRAVADTSRNGTRRYCSRTCANRVNARRHRGSRSSGM